MIRFAAVSILLAVPGAHAVAQHAGHAPQSVAQGVEQGQETHIDHAVAEPETDAHDGHAPSPTQAAPPDVPQEAPRSAERPGLVYAADAIFGAEDMAAAREQLRVEQGGFRTHTLLADRVEAQLGDGDERLVWDLQGWYGGDIHKLWWKSEGAGEPGSSPEDAEVQVLYSRAITPYFDFQAGVRRDFEPSPRRSHAVLGVQGMLPYVFEIDAAAFVSEDGDVTGRFEAEYDLRIRQRLVLQPRVEINFSAQAIPELQVGSGVGSVEGGFRLRYELRRELAPYIGLGWERKRGTTADLARAAGEDARGWKLIGGVQAWF